MDNSQLSTMEAGISIELIFTKNTRKEEDDCNEKCAKNARKIQKKRLGHIDSR